MRRKRSAMAATDDAAAIRFAWWAAFFATLTLVAILGIAKSAQALTVSATGTPGMVAAPAPPPDVEDEEDAEAGEDEGFEDENCGVEEDEECEEESGGPEAPEECLLTSARATVAVAPNQDRVRLQVRYATSTPAAASVDYGLHGSRGSLYLGGEKKQLAKQGVLRLTKTLTEAQMAKVMAAKGFVVRLRVPAAPAHCKAFFDYRLDVRRATPSGLSWRPAE
ncbi:MAG: hypothetical protein WA862_04845 [Solirubrobacterales bacterium]